jgi:hypothetical protein
MRSVTLVLAGLTLVSLGVALGQQWRAALADQLPAEARARLRASTILLLLALSIAAASIFV